MSNNESKSSKVVSVRIPNPMHIAILRNASEMQMTKSDYIFFILDNYLNDHLVELNDGDEVYSKELIECTNSCLDMRNEILTGLESENKMLSEKNEMLENENHNLNKLLNRLRIQLKYKNLKQQS